MIEIRSCSSDLAGLLLLLERVTAGAALVSSLVCVIFEIKSELRIVSQIGMLIDFDHDGVRAAVVAFIPELTVGHAALDIWHSNHPRLRLPAP